MAALLIAAAIAAVPLQPTEMARALPDADPAIWVVNDGDTTIYLFGTFHALDGKSDWFNDEVMTAFAASDELVLETIIPDFSKVGGPLPPPPARRVAVTSSGSFLAATRVAVDAGKSRGLSVTKGADTLLREAAEAQGKPVLGLETIEQQLAMFTRMPGNAAASAPQQRASNAALPLTMALMQASWNRGEQGIFAAMLKRMRDGAPESYKMMFTDRNAHWAQWIAGRLEQPGTVFVAVGAGHLVGADSLQVQLSSLGIKSARIN
jgi:hypothetical protein